jgi:uncharacterized RDD family membrane protein YckC
MPGTVYCSKCGSLVENGAAFCPACGQAVQASAAMSTGLPAGGSSVAALPTGYDPNTYPAAASQTVPPVVYAQPTVQYAGFWLRVVAYLIDSVVMSLGFMALFIPFAIMTGLTAVLGNIRPGEDPRDVGAVLGGTFFLGLFTVVALAFLGGWLYHAKMESSAWQATLGKKALNLRVTDLHGARISFARASGRHFAKLITGMIPLGVGFMLAGLTERRQALHDMIASCLVLRDR